MIHKSKEKLEDMKSSKKYTGVNWEKVDSLINLKKEERDIESFFDKVEKQIAMTRSTRKKKSIMLRQVSNLNNPESAFYNAKNNEET